MKKRSHSPEMRPLLKFSFRRMRADPTEVFCGPGLDSLQNQLEFLRFLFQGHGNFLPLH
jgi:hypothetical protein